VKVRTKLYLGFGSVVALAVIVQVILLINLANVRSSIEQFNNVEVRLLQLANDIRYYDAVLTDSVRAIILDPTDQSLRVSYDEIALRLDEIINEVEGMVTTDEDRQLFQELGVVNDQLWDIELDILANPNVEEAVNLYRGTYGDLKAQYSGFVQTFFDRQTATFNEQQLNIQNNLTLVQTISIGLAIALTILAAVLAVILSSNIMTALNALMRGAQAVSEGNLDAHVVVDNKDELGTLAHVFNEMTQNLKTTMASQVAKE
jgi:HAMP domain-containing protein